jgi:FPC/CPF motif-containing protein YcgG
LLGQVTSELKAQASPQGSFTGACEDAATKAKSDLYEAEFKSFIGGSTFPCLGAKAAMNARSFCFHVYEELASELCSKELSRDLGRFVKSEMRRTHPYATFVAIFERPIGVDEEQFESLLWAQLHSLSAIDSLDNAWDPKVSSDPDHPLFSFSFGGHALYVVGMHDQSSRLSRRFRWPALIFNPHEQFERLRAAGKWPRLQESIRARDVALQGNINPMLSDFGVKPESRQYSGRAVDEHWHAPWPTEKPALSKSATPSRCPFGH